MTNFSLCIWLRQYSIAVGGSLIAIALSACSTSAKPQLPAATIPQVVSPSIASSPPQAPGSPMPSAANVEPRQQEAVQVIRDYYSAIDQRNYEQAYSAWADDGAASQQSFEEFKQGFVNTASTAVKVGEPGRIDGAAGSSYIEIPVTVTATTTDRTLQQFLGRYVLRRVNDVPGSTPEQRRWHFDSANLTQAN